jgi:hypothetical protein
MLQDRSDAFRAQYYRVVVGLLSFVLGGGAVVTNSIAVLGPHHQFRASYMMKFIVHVMRRQLALSLRRVVQGC